MLQSLHIKDFVLIEDLEIDFCEGFNVITGETGAGKSIILDAILFCFGKNFTKDIIRQSTETCTVVAVFDNNMQINSFLEEQAIEIDEQLIIKSVQNRTGRRKLYLNNQITSAKTLRELLDQVLELNGQHNHTTLLNPNSHLSILDQYCNLTHLCTDVVSTYNKWKNAIKQLGEIEEKREQIDREIDYLKHVCLELEKANIEDNEEEKLLEIRHQLQNKEKKSQLIQNLFEELEQNNIHKIASKAQKLESGYVDDTSAAKIISLIEDAYDKLEDAKTLLNNLLTQESEQYSQEELDNRLHEIRTLARKHNVNSNELTRVLEESKIQLTALESKIVASNDLEKQANQYQQDYLLKSKSLSEARKIGALELAKKVMSELAVLDMKKAIFKIEVDTNNDFASSSGVDKVRFIASTNPGIEAGPIDKIASGGELSRFLLALRVSLFDKLPKQTIIFDEIDVGMSGSVADSIGSRLNDLSKAMQLIAITHQPQVAGKAQKHILVEKAQHDKHTVVSVKELSAQDRPFELARMISGKEITKAGIEAAKELITNN
ncbi:MAG: DNA repair protein RecN [Rickettsiales bacterium]|nr:DNA repair protein RecN [Rickettsiales bacterium]MCA0254517.1 DNA repair protein RecN [Pseudomonadota bacterium]